MSDPNFHIACAALHRDAQGNTIPCPGYPHADTTTEAPKPQPPLTVTRVHEDAGSHIEPDLDPTWDEETKLRWQAAVVAHDTGLVIEVYAHPGPGRTSYGINVGEINKGGLISFSAGPYQDAWLALGNVSRGAEAVAARVRQVHRPVEYRGRTICAACSSFYDGSCDNGPCLIGECRTLKAIGGGEAP